MMKRGLSGLVLCAVGVVWVGQGTNHIKGSFMTGQEQWTVIGAVLLLAGAALLAWAWHGRPRRAHGRNP